MASRGEAEQLLQIAPEDGFLLGLREALHGENPGDRPVERHVVRPVCAEHDPVGADGVDQEAQRRLGVDDAVVVEASQIGARRLLELGARLGADLPAVIHPPDPEAGVAAAVAEDDLEIRALVHDAARHQGRERDRAIDQVADGVGQVIALRPRAHQGLAALMEEDQRAELLGRLPEGTELRLLERPAVDVIVDLDALEPDLRHAALELRDRRLDVLHGKRPEPRKPLRPSLRHRADLVVGGPRRGQGDLRVEVIVVEPDVRRDHVHVDAQRVHVAEPLLWRPPGARRKHLAPAADDRALLAALVLLALQRVPVAALLGGLPEALRSQVRVHVDASHRSLPRQSVVIMRSTGQHRRSTASKARRRNLLCCSGHQGGSRAMRVAAIGVSHWHSLYDSAYLVHLAGIPDTELVAIQDESASITAKRAAALGNPAVYTDYRKMLAETRPDFVIALGRPSHMAETAHHLLDQGYPFLMEKPMGVDADEVRRVADKAAAQNAFVAVPLGQRYQRFTTRARQLLAEKRFGPLSHFYVRQNRPTSARYPAWDAAWMLDPREAGGGCLRNLGPHGLDLFLFLTGEEAEVTGAQVSSRALGQPVEDYASVLLRSASGVLGTIEIGNTFPRIGTDGEWKIAWRDAILALKDGTLRLTTAEGEETTAGEPAEPIALTALRDALDHWRRGLPPPIGVHDCLRVVRLIDQAYALARPAK